LQLGDNIFESNAPDVVESLFKAFGPAMESWLSWVGVLGNHYQESTMNHEDLMSLISLMDYSVSKINPSDDDATKGGLKTKIDRFRNYDLKVYGALGSMLANITVLNLFFLDSGDKAVYQGIQTYWCIKESQLHWLRCVSQEFQVTTKSEYCLLLIKLILGIILKKLNITCLYFNFDMMHAHDCLRWLIFLSYLLHKNTIFIMFSFSFFGIDFISFQFFYNYIFYGKCENFVDTDTRALLNNIYLIVE